MYTQCPHCQTCFRIAEEHLKIANGRVRCGSCQEVFDATQHLFKNLTDREPITDYQRPTPTPSKSPAPPPRAKKAEQNHSRGAPSPSPKTVEKILRERDKAPDQDRFMQSMIGNDRYNDLDKMHTIDIPGEIDINDSSIKIPEETDKVEKPGADAAPAPDQRTPYEDIESKEAPTTTAEQETLKTFFAEVDAQLQEDKSKSQLDKDIDELLAFANGLDQDKNLNKADLDTPNTKEPATADSKGIEVSEDFDLDAIADFEKELEASSTGAFTMEQPADLPPAEEQVSKPTKSSAPASSAKVSPPANKSVIAPEEGKASASTDSLPESDKETTHNVTASDEDIPRALRHSLKMLGRAPRRSLGKTVLMSLLILLLIGGLGFQIVLFRNVELVQMYPKLRPVLTQVCQRIPCRYSGQVDVSQIKLINRDVRSDPSQPNALLISATFVDKAPFDQPYPLIQITLYDLGGNVVASRRFTPKEYLAKMYNRFLLMESGTPVHVTLAVLDPGKDAINFEFSFL